MSFFSQSSVNRCVAASAVVLLAGFACLTTTPASAVAISYIYGIDDNNDIYEIDPVGQTTTKVFTSQSPVSGQSNAFAYDRSNPSREFLFFMNGSGSTSGSGQTLYVWNKLTNTQSLVATTTQMGIGGASAQPANAAYYNNSYWFFEEGTTNLYQIGLDYSGANPVFSTQSVYDLSALAPSEPGTIPFPSTTNLFGDIAITPAGILYASNTNGDFYSVDISTTPGDPAGWQYLGNSSAGAFGLQLSFSQDYNTLYGQRFVSGSPATGVWYTIDTTNGALTPLSWTSSVGFRDLGGASPTSAALVPEIDPTAFAGILALVVGMLGLIERRRLAAIA